MKITIDLPDEPYFYNGIPMSITITFSPVMPANDLPESDGLLVARDGKDNLSRCEADDLPLGVLPHGHVGVVPHGHGPFTAGKWGWVITKGYSKAKVAK